METKILLVDDEEMVLSSLKRLLYDTYTVHTETSPQKALERLDKADPYAVIVSDYRMPKMNGIQFLHEAKERSPDTTRIMLTGYADLDNAIQAINDGHIFRFLTKPCDEESLLRNVGDGVKQFELVTAKKVLLEKTLKGSIDLISEITSMVNPEAYARTSRVRRYVKYLVKKKNLDNYWKYDVALMLSQIGTVILPPGTIDKVLSGKKLTPEESEVFTMHPSIASSFIQKLPRLEEVVEMVLYQLKGYDGSGPPPQNVTKDDIPIGGRILKLVLDYDMYLQQKQCTNKAFLRLEKEFEKYDPELLYYLEGMLGVEARYAIRKLPTNDLQTGMILHEDLYSNQGALLLRKSLELTKDRIDRVNLYSRKIGIQKSITVLVPEE